MTNLIRDFTYRYVFAKQKLAFQSRDFKEGGKGNDLFQLSVNDASRMSNAGCYARQSASFLFPILLQFSPPTMFLADKATLVGYLWF